MTAGVVTSPFCGAVMRGARNRMLDLFDIDALMGFFSFDCLCYPIRHLYDDPGDGYHLNHISYHDWSIVSSQSPQYIVREDHTWSRRNPKLPILNYMLMLLITEAVRSKFGL